MQETVEKQNSETLTYYPILHRGNAAKLVQYNPIREIGQLFSLLSEEETATTYQKATQTTWNLLKQTIGLLLFAFCFVIALPIWLCGIGFQTGFHFRRWLETEQPGIETVTARVLDFLGSPFRQVFAWASWFIEQYLNWKVSFTVPEKTTSPTLSTTSSATTDAPSNRSSSNPIS
jgi:hypothetical protein